jgi:hypothetical protein
MPGKLNSHKNGDEETHMMVKRILLGTSLGAGIAVVASCLSAAAQVQKIGDPPEAMNMRLVGHSDLQARSAYQPTIHRQGDRYIAYVGHHGGTREVPHPVNPLTGNAEINGTSIIDVTDPAHPVYLAHIPGEEGQYSEGGAQMARVCDGKDLPKGDPNAVYLLRAVGKIGHEIYDVADPAHPKLITRISESYRDTHKNWWECDTGIAFLVSGVPGWRVPRMTQVFDLSDPAHPVKIRDFGLPGQEPGATGPVPTELHGAISLGRDANRVYVGYGTNKAGVVQILDRKKLLEGPKEPTPENLRYPEIARINLAPFAGAHTALPMLHMPIAEFGKEKQGNTRDIIMIVGEMLTNACQGWRQMVYFADVTIESQPMVVANWTAHEDTGHFCERGAGARFGSHSVNESMAPVFFKKLAFVTYFSGGVRMVDVRDPYQAREVGYFVPAITKATDYRCATIDGVRGCSTTNWTNNVETDDRGYVYITDRNNTGLHILEVTGEPRAIAGLPKLPGE